MMKERPILFSGAMVRAILDGRKTQTRRPVKGWALDWLQSDNFTPAYVADPANRACPYGQAGDRLWVRETFFAFGRWETRFSAKKGRDEWHFIDLTLGMDRIYQYADPTPDNARHRSSVTPAWWKRPAIFMPRAASRIALEILAVRVERLNDCSEGDAVAEGLHVLPASGRYVVSPGEQYAGLANSDPRAVYADLWDRINGAGAWEANPWVWVVEFRKV